MKKLVLTLAAVATMVSAFAQTSGGPDAYGYVWRDSNDPNGPTYNWIDVTQDPNTVQVSGLSDDNVVGPIVINVPFHYYWYQPNLMWIGSNGYVGFTNGNIAAPFPPIPAPALPNDYIGLFTSDLNFNGATAGNPAKCYVWRSTNNDTLVVTWDSVPFWTNANPAPFDWEGVNSFQLVYSAVDSSITMQYKEQIGVYVNTVDFLTLGIENNSGNVGLQHSHDIYPSSNYAIKYYYPQNSSFQVFDAAVQYNDNAETGGRFLSKDGGAYSLVTEVKNAGNQVLNPFNVNGVVRNSLNQTQVTNTVTTDTLQPGQTQIFNMVNTWSPIANGVFRFITTSQLPGDATTSNNIKTCELVVVDTVQNDIRLAFDNGTSSTAAGIAWTGGNAGAGMEFPLPFSPAQITKVHAYIAANATTAGMSLVVYDNSGPNGGPGAMLDSIYVGGPNVLVGAWNDITLSTPLVVSGSSVYLAWLMDGDGIGLGQNQLAPFSNRTYEILGGQWAIYRYREIEDVMLNVTVQKIGTGINEITNDDLAVGNFYPNPSDKTATVDITVKKSIDELTYSIYDSKGMQVATETVRVNAGANKLEINTAVLESGVYFCRFNAGNVNYKRQLTVVK